MTRARALAHPETRAEFAARRRFMTFAILAAALLGAAAGILDSKGVL